MDPNVFGRASSDKIRRLRRLIEKEVSPPGLTLAEFRVLVVLSESGSSPMVDLAKEQMITQAAMTSIVDHLENDNLVKRVRSNTDRRIVNVAITRKGREVLTKGTKLYSNFIEKATANLSDEEIQSLLTIFDKLLDAAQNDKL